eukprot:INCI13490.10.p1 GENE.INCI13490.10~~INCI13490.10.p1  ORF type:complete len:394 (-),score=56.03 INCI13490.10:111-1292(-)
MTSSCLDDHHRVSAATVLVRVERAKTGPDGRSLLSAEGPSADAQTKAKLITPPPDYESGAYDSSRAKPLPCEQERYRSIERMLASGHPDVMETVLDSFQKYNPNELDVDTQPEFEVWWDHQPAKPSDMLNYNKVAKFDPQAGFFFAVDGILRAPQSLCKVVFSLSPPGNFYSKTRKLPDNVHFTHDHDWTSSKRFQQFADEPWKFTQIELLGGYNSKLVVIVEVYALTMNITQKNRPPVAAKPWAWTILPVFLKGEPFVATGAYVLPLLKGPPDLDVLNEAMGGGKGPGEAIEELLANRKLKRMPDKASIRVRLVESQVADCVTMPRDCVYEFYQKRFLSDADAKRYKFTQKNVTERPRITGLLDAAAKRFGSAEDVKKRLNDDFARALGIKP